jgi:hypothetical protein
MRPKAEPHVVAEPLSEPVRVPSMRRLGWLCGLRHIGVFIPVRAEAIACCIARGKVFKTLSTFFVQDLRPPDGAEGSFRFGYPDVSPGARLLTGSALAYRQFSCCGRLGRRARSVLVGIAMSRDIAPHEKARDRFSRRGLNSGDDEHIQVICPTCQKFSLTQGRRYFRPAVLPCRKTTNPHDKARNRSPGAGSILAMMKICR